MTLESVPEYDPERVAESRDKSVVVGASMAGLLAAWILADGYERGATAVTERRRGLVVA